MELRVLRYFLTIAEEENITKASALLHISQPSLSRQMMQLEEELKVKLFRRSNHSIVLTEEGRLLRRRAQEMLDFAEQTKRELSQRDEISGLISIGSGDFKSSSLLARIMVAFQKEHPQIRFELYSGNSDGIKERIERGSLDCGLLLEPVDKTRYDFVRMPIKEMWCVQARKDSPLAGRENVTPEVLCGYPIIFAGRGTVRTELLNWFGQYANRLNIVAGGNLPYNQAMLVREGEGVCTTLDLECRYDDLVSIPLEPPLLYETVFVWKKGQPFTAAALCFIRFFKKYIDGISKYAI